ncbi:MAG TPA: DUF123 domain-containing protein, partial [Archaeoglobus profundus]|nr:DUF123 domain-containing protein [Archaeoglobus profundus]
MYAIIIPISIKIKCLLAKILSISIHFKPIDRFGCSDCSCKSHL